MKINRLMIDGEHVPNFKLGIADSIWLRFRGLLGRSISNDFGLIIKPCNSIHTMWMGYAIDVVFFDISGRITSINSDLRPWKFARCANAHNVLELKSGNAQRLNLKEGRIISWG